MGVADARPFFFVPENQRAKVKRRFCFQLFDLIDDSVPDANAADDITRDQPIDHIHTVHHMPNTV